MSDHVFELLGAYVDGELHGGQLRKVESHLDECQECLEEYHSLQALSEALHAAPVPEFPLPERLAADVALRLPRRPVKPLRRRVMEIGWWLAPVGLIAAWIFVSTTVLVSNVITAAGEFGLFDNASAWLVAGASGANYSAFLGQTGLLTGSHLEWIEITEIFTRANISQLYLHISIALLYLGWMAIWWARHTRQGLGQPFDNGSRPTV